MERDRAKRGSDARPPASPPIFIVLLFVRVDHESVGCDVVDRRDAVYSDLSTGQLLEEGEGLISDTESVCGARIGESAYFRVYIPPIQEFITLDSTEIYRIRNRLEGGRGRGNIRRFDSGFQLDDLNSRSTRRPLCRLATPLSLSGTDNERFVSSWPRLEIDGKIGGARAFSASSLFIFASFK